MTTTSEHIDFGWRWVATWTALVLWSSVEAVSFPFVYIAQLMRPADGLHVAALGVASAFVLSLPVSLAWHIGHTVLKQTPASPRMLSLIPAMMAVTGLALVNTGSGSIVHFGGVTANVAILGVIGVMSLVIWLVGNHAHQESVAAANRAIVPTALLAIWFFSDYLPDYACGQLGFEENLLRPAIISVFILGSLSLPLVALVWSEQARRRSKRIVAVAAVIVNVVFYVGSARFYVDDYSDIHWWLFVMCVWSTIALVALWLPRFTFKRGWIASLLAAGLGGGFLLTGGSSTVAGYLATIHTTFQRHEREAIRTLILLPSEVRTRMNRQRRRSILACGGALPIAAGSLPASFETPTFYSREIDTVPAKNVVMFLLDMKRPQDIGLYEEGESRTPKIDACLSGASVFDRAYSAGASTSVAFPSIYTGSYEPSRQFDEFRTTRPSWFGLHRRNITAVMKKNGLKPILVSGEWYEDEFFTAASETAIYGGFETTLFENGAKGSSSTMRLIRAYDALEGGIVPVEGRFLMIVHIPSHALAEIGEVDDLVGRVCEELQTKRRFQETAFLLTADHGIQFREHGRTTYGHTAFDEEIRVPLVVKIPGVVGKRISDVVSSTDHFPTLVDAIGGSFDFPIEGRSYLPLLVGDKATNHTVGPMDRPVFSQTHHPDFPSSAVISWRYKLIRWHTTGQLAMFDLSADPLERTNLIETDDHQQARERLLGLLDDFVTRAEASPGFSAEEQQGVLHSPIRAP